MVGSNLWQEFLHLVVVSKVYCHVHKIAQQVTNIHNFYYKLIYDYCILI